jgi:hypothetical protein
VRAYADVVFNHMAINKTEERPYPAIWTWGLRLGRYRCQIHQYDMEVSAGTFESAIPPREAQLWLYAGDRETVRVGRKGKGAMLNVAVPVWELVVRAVVVYVFLLLLLRITGKRQVGQLAPFDLVLLLVLSNAVQNSINAGDNSLIGGLVSAATLIALNFVLGCATYKNKRLEAMIEGRPELIVHNGQVFKDAMAKAKLTHHELESALRQAGCASVGEVQAAIMENNGSITVLRRMNGGHSPSS